jgi:hypothetical protein
LVLFVVAVVVVKVMVLVKTAFLRNSFLNEFVVILVSKADIHFPLVVEAEIKKK